MDLLTAKGKPHIQQVDYVRAIASLAVAQFHMGGKTLPVFNYGWVGVYMFFLLSGFIICWAIPINYSWKLSWTFISKRIVRIEPPYLISVVLAVVVNYFWIDNYQPNWQFVFFHVAYLNNFFGQQYLTPVYWTLGIEFQFYLFIALIFPFIIKKWGPYLLVVLCIILFFIKIPGTTLFGFFPPFALGILYFLFLKNKIGITEALFLGVVMAVCCLRPWGWPAAAATLFAWLLLVLPLKSNRVIAFFSKISFSLYLTHDIIGSRWVIFMGQRLPKTFAFKGFELISGILISIVFAYIFYLLIEQPSLKLSKRISYK